MQERRKTFSEAINKIYEKDKSIAKPAYFFLKKIFNHILEEKESLTSQVDISAKELLENFRHLSLKEFGIMTYFVMQRWGIHSTEEIGKMIFFLIAENQISQSSSKKEDFKKGFCFQKEFIKPFLPKNENKQK